MKLSSVDLSDKKPIEELGKVCNATGHPQADTPEAAYRSGVRHSPRLAPSSAAGQVPPSNFDAGFGLITGGLGGLGLLAAEVLTEQGVLPVALMSRSGIVPAGQGLEDLLRSLQSVARASVLCRCDMARPSELAQFVDSKRSGGGFGVPSSLKVVIHAAGLLRDALMINQTATKVLDVFGPKVKGAWNLHTQLSAAGVQALVCFSSEAALLGAVGQSVYSSANGYLDGLMHW